MKAIIKSISKFISWFMTPLAYAADLLFRYNGLLSKSLRKIYYVFYEYMLPKIMYFLNIHKLRPYLKKCGKNLTIRGCIEMWPVGCNLNVSIGENVSLYKGVKIQGNGTLTIGNNTTITSNVYIGVMGKIEIGNYVMIADNVSMRTDDHAYERADLPMALQGAVSGDIVIEDDVWIGYGAVITKGVRIGKGSIIGANAVVVYDVADYSVVGGVPAKLLKKRE